MTAEQLLFILRARTNLDPVDYLLYAANHVHEFRLRDGQRLNDATDLAAFLLELAQAAKSNGKAAPRVTAVDLSCPRCGHVHEGDRECGVVVPGAGVCRCEMEVPA